jgi:hypothetical protein
MEILKTYQTEQDAVIDSLVLKNNGIKFEFIKNDVTPYPSLTNIYGYSLLVNESDYVKAIECLNNKIEVSENNFDETISAESPVNNSPVNYKWYLYTGIIIGIIVGIFCHWGYSYIKYLLSDFPKINYSDGLPIRVIEDRNKDDIGDYWQKWDSRGNAYNEGDNNYDGKIDYWLKEIDSNLEKEDKDCDFNGVPDETNYYKYYIIQRKIIHPNSNENVRVIQEYSISGILQKELLDSDSIPGINLVKHFNEFGNIIKEEVINDSIVQLE